MIEFHVTISNLNELQAAFAKSPQITKEEIIKAIDASLLGYQADIKRNAPVDTGRYRASVTITPAKAERNVISGKVGPQTNYAEAIETGTGIYGPRRRPITPKRAKALAFTIGGRKVVVRSVRGMPGKHPVERAFIDGQGRTDRYFERAAENITNRMAGGVR